MSIRGGDFINKFKELLDYYFNVICIGLIIFLLSGVIVLIYRSFTNTSKDIKNNNQIAFNENQEQENTTSLSENIKVDIKGAVKNPSVYEIARNSNVIDLINLAGGLTKNATTENVNLSRVLEDQMVIKIFTKTELKKLNGKENTISECVCDKVIINECNETNSAIIKTNGENINIIDSANKSNSQINNENIENGSLNDMGNNKLISINVASKEELLTLDGIGESKANAIIEYRKTNGNFKTIDEIKNVSGIGEALFAKIKDNITI